MALVASRSEVTVTNLSNVKLRELGHEHCCGSIQLRIYFFFFCWRIIQLGNSFMGGNTNKKVQGLSGVKLQRHLAFDFGKQFCIDYRFKFC